MARTDDDSWEVAAVEAAELMDRYGRRASGEVDDASPRTVFVEGQLAC